MTAIDKIYLVGFMAAGKSTVAKLLGARLGWRAEDIDELMLIGTFLRRPPPELRVAPLERGEILRQAAALPRALSRPPAPRAPARARAA